MCDTKVFNTEVLINDVNGQKFRRSDIPPLENLVEF